MGDSWQRRYLALVPEKLTAEDAEALLDLMREDLGRLQEALETFVVCSEDSVFCECSPARNPDCNLGSHADGHMVKAQWRLSDAQMDGKLVYLCTACKESRAQQSSAGDLYSELLGNQESGEEVFVERDEACWPLSRVAGSQESVGPLRFTLRSSRAAGGRTPALPARGPSGQAAGLGSVESPFPRRSRVVGAHPGGADMAQSACARRASLAAGGPDQGVVRSPDCLSYFAGRGDDSMRSRLGSQSS